jgi:hypothetical protein
MSHYHVTRLLSLHTGPAQDNFTDSLVTEHVREVGIYPLPSVNFVQLRSARARVDDLD